MTMTTIMIKSSARGSSCFKFCLLVVWSVFVCFGKKSFKSHWHPKTSSFQWFISQARVIVLAREDTNNTLTLFLNRRRDINKKKRCHLLLLPPRWWCQRARNSPPKKTIVFRLLTKISPESFWTTRNSRAKYTTLARTWWVGDRNRI